MRRCTFPSCETRLSRFNSTDRCSVHPKWRDPAPNHDGVPRNRGGRPTLYNYSKVADLYDEARDKGLAIQEHVAHGMNVKPDQASTLIHRARKRGLIPTLEYEHEVNRVQDEVWGKALVVELERTRR